MKRSLVVTTLLLAVVSCSPTLPPDTRTADEVAIKQALAAGDKSIADKNVDQVVGFFADDATIFAANAPAMRCTELTSALKQAFADPNFSVKAEPLKIEVARAGDLAYGYGTYVQTSTDPTSKQVVTDRGNWVTAFKKQPDGKWKAVADVHVSTAPPQPH